MRTRIIPIFLFLLLIIGLAFSVKLVKQPQPQTLLSKAQDSDQKAQTVINFEEYKNKYKECTQKYRERYEECMGEAKKEYEKCLYEGNYDTCGELLEKHKQCSQQSEDKECLRDLGEKWHSVNPNSLPLFEIPDESDQIQKGASPTAALLQSLTAPSKPIRQPAEFESLFGVLIRYPFGISYEIIQEIAEDAKVVTIVKDDNEKNEVTRLYTVNNVNMENVEFLIAPTETWWTRDYGPWFDFTGSSSFVVTDFNYNRPARPNDNGIPQKYAIFAGLGVYNLGLTHTGGNYMTDGLGIAVSTDLIIEENSVSVAEIKQRVADFLGIQTYHIVPDVTGEYIKHIDTWAKFLAPDKILLRQVPASHSQYDEIEAAVDYFKNQASSYGKPYKIFRVNTPNDEPYTNSLILNGKVFVPIVGSEHDNAALEIYQQALPGYEVIGFEGNWFSTDALHCRTKQIPDRHMLHIKHLPITEGQYIEAEIIPYSGTGLKEELTTAFWSTDKTNWNPIKMTKKSNSIYSVCLPSQQNGAEVFYYLHAEDFSGRNENHPYIGSPGAHSFIIGDEPLANDRDRDRIDDYCDNCPGDNNPDQSDADGDGIGNACEKDWGDTSCSSISDFKDIYNKYGWGQDGVDTRLGTEFDYENDPQVDDVDDGVTLNGESLEGKTLSFGDTYTLEVVSNKYNPSNYSTAKGWVDWDGAGGNPPQLIMDRSYPDVMLDGQPVSIEITIPHWTTDQVCFRFINKYYITDVGNYNDYVHSGEVEDYLVNISFCNKATLRNVNTGSMLVAEVPSNEYAFITFNFYNNNGKNLFFIGNRAEKHGGAETAYVPIRVDLLADIKAYYPDYEGYVIVESHDDTDYPGMPDGPCIEARHGSVAEICPSCPQALLPSDLDCDCDVDIIDVMKIASVWNTREGDPDFNPNYDFDNDGRISVVEVMQVANKWDTSCE